MSAIIGVLLLAAWALTWPFADAGHPRLDATKNRATRIVYFALAVTASPGLIAAAAWISM
jgi:hypothetical protein